MCVHLCWGRVISPVYTGPPPEVDSNPDSEPHSTGRPSCLDCNCIYTELNPDLVLEKWSRVNEANLVKLNYMICFCHISIVHATMTNFDVAIAYRVIGQVRVVTL